MKNKKGNGFAIILFIFALFLLILFAVAMAFGTIIIDWVFDEAVPELTGLGQVGDANMTSIGKSALDPVNTFVQSLTFLTGVVYILGIIGIFGLATALRITGNKWLAGFFIACMILLVMASIFVSNIYEEFYNENSEIGTRLHEHTLLSFLILNSPLVVCIVGLGGGIIIFTGEREEGFA